MSGTPASIVADAIRKHGSLGAAYIAVLEREAQQREALLVVASLLEEIGQWFIEERPSVPKRLEEVVLAIEEQISAVVEPKDSL